MTDRPAIDSLILALIRHFGLGHFEPRQFGAAHQITSDTVAWHSATYCGQRHTIEFTTDNSACLNERLDSLADLDIPLCRGFVGDIAAVVQTNDQAGVAIKIEVLTLDA